MDKFKSGFIAIIGKPNAGKSTLLNSLIKQKVSIVSPKPQTTRNKVLGIWTEQGHQMVFVDTPGLLRAKNSLGQYMEKSIDSGIRDVNCILYVVDGHKGFNDRDIELMTKYSDRDIPFVVAVTKTDICQPETLMAELTKLNSIPNVSKVYCISSRKNKNIDTLKEGLKEYLTDDVQYFGEDEITDKPMRFLVSEIIREKILLNCDEEVPHGVGVELNKMQYCEVKKKWDIDANIIVERASHKPIILGKNGCMIKTIGMSARESIEKMLGARCYLALWIRVKEGWRDSDFLLKEIGYNKKDL